MIRYVSPDISLIDFQDRYVEGLVAKCKQVMYNSDIFSREEIATTATEKTIDLDAIYDTLFPLSVKFSTDWKYFVTLTAKLTDMENNLTVVMTFAKDFKFKTKQDLVNERGSALTAGCPDDVLRDIDDDIMRITTSDNPYDFRKYKTMQTFYPFSGKSIEEKLTIKSSGTVPEKIKVLDDNYGWIFDELEMENPGFYDMPKLKQKELIDAKVEQIIEENPPSEPQYTPPSLEEVNQEEEQGE
jgi:hypothetical protein